MRQIKAGVFLFLPAPTIVMGQMNMSGQGPAAVAGEPRAASALYSNVRCRSCCRVGRMTARRSGRSPRLHDRHSHT